MSVDASACPQRQILIEYDINAHDEHSREKWMQQLATVLRKKLEDEVRRNKFAGLLLEYLIAMDLEGSQDQPIHGLYKLEPEKIKTIPFGRIEYKLLRQTVAAYIDEYKLFIAEAFAKLDLRGMGANADLARDDFFQRVHQRFQSLYSMPKGAMTSEQREDWERLTEIIDVNAYEREVPIRFKKVAVVKSHFPFEVRWWGDEYTSVLDLRQAPPEIACLNPGDMFEATVELDRATKKINQIVSFEHLRGEPISDINPTSGLNGLQKVSLDDIWKRE